MIVRITEQVATVREVSYDVELPDGADLDEAEEYLDRANDEVHSETLRKNAEILSVEPI